MKLLGIGSNAKTVKSDAGGEYLTAILYAAPAREHGTDSKKTMCPSSTAGCEAACLYTAGRGRMNSIQEARKRKSVYYLENQTAFLTQLKDEVTAFEKKCYKLDVTPVVRLNGTSDVPWETLGIEGKRTATLMETFPKVQWYDYTKSWSRAGKTPANYHLTLSRGEETSDSQVRLHLALRQNVAIVFEGPMLPTSHLGYPVVDGDVSDLRFLDGAGVIVGLRAKGDAKKDTSGFVVKAVVN